MQIGLTSYSLGNSLPVLPKQVAAILRKFGSDAHLYMPGPGVPVLGPDKTPAGTTWLGFNANLSSATLPATATQTGSINYGLRLLSFLTIGKEYKVTVSWSGNSSGRAIKVDAAGATNLGTSASGTASATFKATDVAHYIYAAGAAGGESFTINSVLTEEVTGYTNQVSGFTTGNYLESTGNTNAVVDGAVGLVLDAAGSVGAEISTNNDFTGWSGGAGWTFSGGKARANAATGNASRLATLTAGKTYKVILRCDSYTSGGYKVLYEGGQSLIGDKTSAGTFEATVQANATGQIYIWVNSTLTATFDYVSIKEITGIHATQATTANKPTLRRGIVNLALNNGSLNGASYSRVNSAVTENYATAPDGTQTAHRLQITAANGALQQSRPELDTKTYSQGVWVKSNTGANQQFQWWNGTATITGTATAEWQLVCSGASLFATGSRFDFGSVTNGADLLIWRPGVFQGTLTAQQILAAGGIPLTTTAPASSSAGKYAWQHDGSDNFSLGAAPFQAQDDWCVIVGSTPTTNNPTAGMFSISSGGGTSELMTLAYSVGKPQVYLATGGVTKDIIGAATLAAGTPHVISGQKAAGALTGELNGASFGSLSTTGIGSSAYTNSTIGNYVTSFHTGYIHTTLVIKGTVSPSDKKTLTKWIGSLAGVSIP